VNLISIIHHLKNAEIIIPLYSYNKALNILQNVKTKYSLSTNLSLVSIIGTGIKYDTYIVTKILNFLKELPTTVHSLISSEFKISILIEEKYANDLLINLHKEFIENCD
jgi:aspartokinase